jgi:hypothetical protein
LRPTYQSEADEAEEREIALRLAALGCEVARNKRYYPFDFSVIKGGRIVGLAEFKRRRHPYGTYPTIILSLHKFAAATNYHHATNLPIAFFVRWDGDQVGLCDLHKLKPEDVTISIGGREDRNDSEDMEPVIHIPIAKFRGLKRPSL